MLDTIRQNIAEVQGRIDEATRRAGRPPGSVRLVAVTKYVDLEATRAVIQAGCRLLGESRPQSLVSKAESLAGESVEWHLIGQLQRNKIRRLLPVVSMVESIDSLKLLDALDRVSAELGLTTKGLLEVNISGDTSKSGFVPDEMDRVVEQLDKYHHVQIRGLMGMASLTGGVEVARRNFATLRQLRDRLATASVGRVTLPELSMGMSDDFQEAILEGATFVRIGSALFEGV